MVEKGGFAMGTSVHGRRRRVALAAVTAIVVAAGHVGAEAAPENKVLILGSTVTGGSSSLEATQAAAMGFQVDVVDGATWGAMTTEDFAAYRAIILGDPTCRGGTSSVTPAEQNAEIWSEAVAGNVIIVGTDPEWHWRYGGRAGARDLTQKGIALAAADEAKTGAYITLSCYYHGVAPMTPVPLLDGFGAFTVTGVGCYNNAHIVATHPALDGLTDASLSGWSCSVHEAFDSWPDLEFEVLAIARDFGGAYEAPDGSVGTPYILARGVRVISDIDLTPEEAVRRVTREHELAATVAEDDVPVVGTEVTFRVLDGPNAGTIGTASTDGDGIATFSYVGQAVGVDTVDATFVDSLGRNQRSNRVTVEWVACLEDGLDQLDGTPLEGVASGAIHDQVEPAATSVDPSIGDLVHEVNCTIVEPTEVMLENNLG